MLQDRKSEWVSRGAMCSRPWQRNARSQGTCNNWSGRFTLPLERALDCEAKNGEKSPFHNLTTFRESGKFVLLEGRTEIKVVQMLINIPVIYVYKPSRSSPSLPTASQSLTFSSSLLPCQISELISAFEPLTQF